MNWDALPNLITGLMALGVFVAIAWYILSKIRDGQKKSESDSSQQLTLFGELYRSGEITKEEYNAIRTQLAASIAASRTSAEPEKTDDRQAELERLLNAERR